MSRKRDRESLYLEIDKHGNFTEQEKQLIETINESVMAVDGTAEGWSYDLNPLDYVEVSVDIFNLTKKYFSHGHN